MTELAPQPGRLVSERIMSVDLLRGVAIVLMSLDHVREFLSAPQYGPLDLNQTYPALFFTRWITHFCPTIFVFLAGTGSYLALVRGSIKPHLARFLLIRGLWLVVLELTLVRLGWYFNIDYSHSVAQVIWAIGWSMVAMAPLVFLPTSAIAVFGVCVIAFHNLFDNVLPETFGRLGWLWTMAHHGGGLRPLSNVGIDPPPEVGIHVAYPFLPWLGVMACGYAFGALLQLPRGQRRRQLYGLGGALIVLFMALRATNVYGDPAPWTAQSSNVFTMLSFLNCDKYPPSLLYTLMTLGPAIIALAVFDREPGWLGRRLITFGRVPLFFYLIHLPIIHGLAIAFVYLQVGETPAWLFSFPPGHAGEGCGFHLPMLYLIWLGVAVFLYPVCHWYSQVKRNHPRSWLRFL